jgi:hypothetical protein
MLQAKHIPAQKNSFIGDDISINISNINDICNLIALAI